MRSTGGCGCIVDTQAKGITMPRIGRRRPLARAAVVGGAGYAAGKHRAGRQEEQAEQEAAAQAQQAPEAAPPEAAPPSPMTQSDQVEALKNLKDLLDSGVL